MYLRSCGFDHQSDILVRITRDQFVEMLEYGIEHWEDEAFVLQELRNRAPIVPAEWWNGIVDPKTLQLQLTPAMRREISDYSPRYALDLIYDPMMSIDYVVGAVVWLNEKKITEEQLRCA